MGRELANEFSWSKSRHEKLAECARAYYLHYYASWGGWSDDAPKQARELYILKKLSNRYTWAGSVVHDSIRLALLDLKQGRDVSAEAFIHRAHLQMRDDFRHSRDKAYWREKLRRNFAGLAEHEYAEPIRPEDWKANWDTAKAALEWFFNSRWIALAKSLKPEQWLEVDNHSFEETAFELEGVRVFAIPDFAYVDASGTPVVVDWKTGRAREGYDEQVLGYALYLSTRYKFPVEAVQASLVYLNDGLEQMVQVDGQAVEGFKAHFRKSVTRMRELLVDPAKNAAKPEAHFPQTEDLSSCARCVFRRACKRESAAAVKVA